MVFYFFVYHNVARKSRKVDQIRLSNGKVLTQVKSVNGLMQQKAMPITSVKFEGWLATPTSSSEQDHPLLSDESLAEMLARVSREQEQQNKSKRKIISTRKKKKPSSTPYKPPKDSRFQFASESDIADSEEKFSPPMACVTVGSPSSHTNNTCAGCMRVKTLQESLSSSNGADKNGLDTQNSIQTGRTLSSNASNSSSTSSVHFGTVEIRQYEYCLGDNPSCSSCPPIMLDWKYSTIGAFLVHNYDDYKSEDREASPISHYDRVELLRKLGYSRSDMMRAEKQRQKDQAQREETIYRLRYMQREEKTESVKKRFKTVLHIR